MKKFFLLAAAAVVAFASCSKNDQPEQREAAIAFSSYTGRSISKADADYFVDKSKTALVDGREFGVFAYLNTDAFSNTSVSNVFMKNQNVKFSGTATEEASYTYSPLRYWPNDETNKLSFFAYYPYGTGTGITVPDNGWASYEFTAKTDPAEMVDFLVSDVAADKTYSNAVNANNSHKGVVTMKFHHALSMVKFKVNTDADYAGTVITLKSIKVAGVNTYGKVTPAYATSGTTFTWSDQGTTAEFTVFEGTKVLNTTAAFLPTGTEADDAFLMVPQTLADAVVATVVYTVQTGTDAEVENTASIVLNTAKDASNNPIAAWNMNQNTVYTFTVGLKPIKFIAQVLPWDDPETVSGITIPAE